MPTWKTFAENTISTIFLAAVAAMLTYAVTADLPDEHPTDVLWNGADPR